MLFEALEYVATPAIRQARRTGLLAEAIAIRHRHRRRRAAWLPHLERTKQLVAAAAEAAPGSRKAVVFGAGLLLDIPIELLAGRFDDVVLVDLVHLHDVRRLARRRANIRLHAADLTGLDGVWEESDTATGLPPVPGCRLYLDDPDVDLVVSANLLSQLPVFPAQAVARRRGIGGEALHSWQARIVAAHIDHLRAFACPVCLVSEVERLVRDRDGRVLARQDPLFGNDFPGDGMHWEWQLAPPGELSGGQHVTLNIVGSTHIPKMADSAGARLDTVPTEP